MNNRSPSSIHPSIDSIPQFPTRVPRLYSFPTLTPQSNLRPVQLPFSFTQLVSWLLAGGLCARHLLLHPRSSPHWSYNDDITACTPRTVFANPILLTPCLPSLSRPHSSPKLKILHTESVSLFISLASISAMSVLFGRKTAGTKLSTINYARGLVVSLYIISWTFSLVAAMLVQTNNFNTISCTMSVYMCITLYALSKIIIYLFLMEKVYVVTAVGTTRANFMVISILRQSDKILCKRVNLFLISNQQPMKHGGSYLTLISSNT